MVYICDHDDAEMRTCTCGCHHAWCPDCETWDGEEPQVECTNSKCRCHE